MEEYKYEFQSLNEIIGTAKSYLDHDPSVKLKLQNGLTEKIYLEYRVVLSFISHNYDLLEKDSLDSVIPECFEEVIDLCSRFYGIPRNDLKKSYLDYTQWGFIDPEIREKEIAEWRITLEKEGIKHSILVPQ